MLHGNDSKSTLRGIVRRNCSTWLSIGQQWKDKTLVKKKVPIRIEETEAEMERRQYKLIYKENGWKDGGFQLVLASEQIVIRIG